MSRTGKHSEGFTARGQIGSKRNDWIDALTFLKSRRWRILIWGVAGLVFSLLIAPVVCKFSASVRLMPPDGFSEEISFRDLAFVADTKSPDLVSLSSLGGNTLEPSQPTQSGALFVKVLQSHTVEDSLIRRFDLRKHYWKKYSEDAREKLESNTSIEEDKKSGLIAVTVRDRDPQFSSMLASAYIEELDRVLSQVTSSAAGRQRIFIDERIEDEKKVLDAAEQRLSQFSSKSLVLNVPEQTRVALEHSARLQGQVIAGRAELQDLQQVYGPESSRVRTAQAHIAELERELDSMNTGANGASGASSDGFPSARNLPRAGIVWSNLYREAKIHETVYELLTREREIARIEEARQLPSVKVLDDAIFPERRHPGLISVVVGGTLLSLLLACIGALVQRRWRSWDSDDPRRLLLARMSFKVSYRGISN